MTSVDVSARRLLKAVAADQAGGLWQAVQRALSVAGLQTLQAPGVRTNSEDWVLQGRSMTR